MGAEQVLIETSARGVPLRFKHDGQTWRIAAQPTHWHERTNWWEESRRYPRGEGPAIDLEVWRVQVRPHASAELVTVDLIREQDRAVWLLRPFHSPAAA